MGSSEKSVGKEKELSKLSEGDLVGIAIRSSLEHRRLRDRLRDRNFTSHVAKSTRTGNFYRITMVQSAIFIKNFIPVSLLIFDTAR